jgi:protein-L-isoaspartate(D-aspartate) O-methyltransferase
MIRDHAYAEERLRLVERMRLTANIRDERVLVAFRSVPRHRFLPDSQVPFAYEDRALPLAEQQTISQPSMIAIMLEALRCRPGDHALEVGAGSGYAAALLGELVARVDAVEIRPALAEQALATLASLQIDNVEIHTGDGGRGFAERAPFDKILVEQLARGGRIAIPVGDEVGQTLLVGERAQDGRISWEPGVPCVFVPLVAPN